MPRFQWVNERVIAGLSTRTRFQWVDGQALVKGKALSKSKASPPVSPSKPTEFDPVSFDPDIKDLPKVVLPFDIYKKIVMEAMGKVPMGFNVKIEPGFALLQQKAASWLKSTRTDKKIREWIAKGEKSLAIMPEPKKVEGYEGQPWPDMFTELHELGHSAFFKFPDPFRKALEAAYFSMPQHEVMAKIYAKRGYHPHKQPGEYFADTFAFMKFDKALLRKWLSKSKDDLIHTLDTIGRKGGKPAHVQYKALAADIEKSGGTPPDKVDKKLPSVNVNPTTKPSGTSTAPAGYPDLSNIWVKRLAKVIKKGQSMGKTPEEVAQYLLTNVNIFRKNPGWEP